MIKRFIVAVFASLAFFGLLAFIWLDRKVQDNFSIVYPELE